MEVRSSEEVRQNIETFVKEYVAIMLRKKELDNELKELKNSYKEEGVAVGIVTKVINRIKSDKSKTDAQKFEEDMIKEWLVSNKDIDDQIGILFSK